MATDFTVMIEYIFWKNQIRRMCRVVYSNSALEAVENVVKDLEESKIARDKITAVHTFEGRPSFEETPRNAVENAKLELGGWAKRAGNYLGRIVSISETSLPDMFPEPAATEINRLQRVAGYSPVPEARLQYYADKLSNKPYRILFWDSPDLANHATSKMEVKEIERLQRTAGLRK